MIGQMALEKFKILVNFFEQTGLPCKKMDQPDPSIGDALLRPSNS
jgi:hypothetical protein